MYTLASWKYYRGGLMKVVTTIYSVKETTNKSFVLRKLYQWYILNFPTLQPKNGHHLTEKGDGVQGLGHLHQAFIKDVERRDGEGGDEGGDRLKKQRMITIYLIFISLIYPWRS